MLKLRILSIGKEKDRWLGEGCDHYLKLLSRYANVQLQLIPTSKAPPSLSPQEIKARDTVLLEKAIGSDLLVALHDRGEKFDSIAFSKRLERLQDGSGGRITMVIGGAFGLDERILNRASLVLSLSELTMSHQLTRLVLLEQLYRGFSILHGTAYHK